MRESSSRIASSEIFSSLVAALIAEFSLITAPFINPVGHRHAPFAASVIQADRSSLHLVIAITSSAYNQS
jgi:hypothetical protein